MTPPSPPRVRAPRLPAEPSRWLNTDGPPPTFARGTTYLLDFFTSGCVNCLHVLPDLAYLEARYAGRPFVVVGVHSGKFPGERGVDAVRQAVERLRITHPVLVDAEYAVWREYAVRAWPTFVLVDRGGYIALTVSGEGRRATLVQALDALLPDAGGADAAPPGATLPAPVPHPATAAPLRFPGKVLADAAGNRLFIADTGQCRIVVAPLSGSGAYVYFGAGTPGFADGPADTARFRAPQGMTLSPDGGLLYVADAGNHAVRRIHLGTGEVTTLAGTGEQGIGAVPSGPGRATPLNSPWDLCLAPDGGALFVAMAGAHQVVRVRLGDDGCRVEPMAGSGREGRQDGAFVEAAFAQPSDVTTDGARLFVADAESSCVRSLDLVRERVETVAGGDLFDWGGADGSGAVARFQHPAGIVYHRGMLYVADTYNHCLRRVHPRTGETTTLPGGADGLNGPGGVSASGDLLYVADTNNHRIRTYDLARERWETLPLPGLCAPGRCFPNTNTPPMDALEQGEDE